jgi:hypothetical protein
MKNTQQNKTQHSKIHNKKKQQQQIFYNFKSIFTKFMMKFLRRYSGNFFTYFILAFRFLIYNLYSKIRAFIKPKIINH